ncbi:MAG: GNAT family N-acetyltransferase [Anaerolineales bacterium]|nr:GNAT family N-acetyltransferase [Anaerolineales bacterium]
MKLLKRLYQEEADYWRIRNFLREVFLLNGRIEHSWHVARLDYWRWHIVLNIQACKPVEKVTTLWETTEGQIAAVLHPVGWGEIRLHVHPNFRTPELEEEILVYAEEHLTEKNQTNPPYIYTPVFKDDISRQETLTRRGFNKTEGVAYHWRRDFDTPLPEPLIPAGFLIRSMGTIEEHPIRSWASWRSFHSDEPDENYDGDWSWYQNIQSAPLYRRDLDIVAEAPDGSLASFCTIFFDDFTRSAVCVLVGTAAEYWRRGLGKAVMIEGMRRLQKLGCTRVFATAYDSPPRPLYRSVMRNVMVSETWLKELPEEKIL